MSLADDLMVELGLGPNDFHLLITTAPKRYKTYFIPKRNGRMRQISQPSAELKLIQRYILQYKLSALPVHDAAMAYVSDKNILANARAHRQNRVILKLDFRDFFPSLLLRDWQAYAKRADQLIIAKQDLPVYAKAMFYGKGTYKPECLSIGAPTSPALSNILLFDLDTQISEVARESGVIYTRYADDITASANSLQAIRDFEDEVRRIVAASKTPRLTFNDEKRGLYMRGQRRMVTGLILTPQGRVSIGRERKRLVSVLLHKAAIGEIDSERMAQLKGLLGFCISTEPEFVGRMRDKYGSDVVNGALRFEIPPRSMRRSA